MRSILLTTLFLLALACGSGGGTQVAGGGIGGTGISSGSVTGFGSFFVTGTEWDVGPEGTVEIDGEPATEDELQLGMFLRVEGARSPDGSTGVATRVRFDAAVRGAMSGPPLLAGPERLRFTVLGHVVEADEGQTVFAGTTFATLAEDDVLEVSGPVAADGTIRATRIVWLGTFPDVADAEVRGTVSGADSAGFSLGTVGVTLDDCDGMATVIEPPLDPDPELLEGELVEVEGLQVGTSPDQVDACTIRPFTPLAAELGDDAENVELEGVIEDFTDLASFSVNGVSVNASGAELEPGNEALFDDGVLVEAKGDIEGGVLVAEQLELQEGEARVAAQVTAQGLANVGARQLVLLDDGAGSRLEIVVPASTRIEGDDDDGSLSLSELSPGDFLEVRGVDLGNGRMRATEIEVEDDGDDGVEIRGRVTDVDTTSDGGMGITVLGVFVQMMETTELPDGYGSLAEFLDDPSIRGALVEAEDEDVDPPTTFGIAESVELEEDDDSDDDDDDD